jgi:NADPH:quinone reductase-like Zn-dependent oxidoreductase
MKHETLLKNGRPRAATLAGLLGLCTGLAMGATPSAQRAIVQSGNGGPEVLSLQTVPVPEPGAGEVLIRIYAASVNPTDWKLRQGDRSVPAGAGAKVIPGRDVAGVVERVGPAVSAYKAGDKVFALVGPGSRKALNGAYSEYVVALVNDIARKPAKATFEEAAALGVTGGTAVRLLDMLNITSGQRVFIDGVAGGVAHT